MRSNMCGEARGTGCEAIRRGVVDEAVEPAAMLEHLEAATRQAADDDGRRPAVEVAGADNENGGE